MRDATKPIFCLTSGRKGYTILSHSTGPDWCNPESYIDEVREDYAPLFAAAPGLLAALERVEKRLTAAARAFYVDNKPAALKLALAGWKDDIEPARAAIAAATKSVKPAGKAAKFAGAGIERE